MFKLIQYNYEQILKYPLLFVYLCFRCVQRQWHCLIISHCYLTITLFLILQMLSDTSAHN